MDEDVLLILDLAKDGMEKAMTHLDVELAKIRAGKANPRMLDGVQVDYYGSMTPLSQVANINTPDAKTISVQPWERAMIDPIERAILNSNIGLNPVNNGEIIRLNVPPLTEERRRDLVKNVKEECENARISLRNARKSAIDEIKKLQKDGLSEDLAKDREVDIQEMTDNYNKNVEEMYSQKEKEIITI